MGSLTGANFCLWLTSEVPDVSIEVRSSPDSRHSDGDFRFSLRSRRASAVAIESEPDPKATFEAHQFVPCYTEGFSHFVASMTASVASGWSDGRAGFAPTEKCRLAAAHTQSRHSADMDYGRHRRRCQPISSTAMRSDGP